jgi:peptide/nickel transport system permease protein
MAADTTASPAPRRSGPRVNRPIAIGGGMFVVLAVVAIFAPLIAPHAPDANNFRLRLAPPDATHLFGTDHYGRDVLSRVIHGMRISLGIGVAVALLTGIAGLVLGAISGFFDRVDGPLMRMMDAAMAFPSTLLAISIAAVLGPSVQNAVLALFFVYTPRTARVVRSSVLQLRHSDYVEAARALGAGPWRLLTRHILPNAMAPFIVQSTFVFAVAILAEAVLSFIGVGPQPPTPSLGNIIAEGRAYIDIAPWVSLLPGVMIVILVLSLNLLGDGLRDATDPRLVERGS